MKKQIDEKKIAEKIGYKPNKWQKEVDSAEGARFITLNVGRRGGKTRYVATSPVHGIARDFLLPDQHVWIVAPDYDLTQRVWQEVKILANKEFKPLVKRFTDTKGAFKIETHLNTVIEAKSAKDPESLIGVGLTKLVIDEASRVAEKAWYQSLRPTLADKKGKAIFISTPNGRNWFHDVYRKGVKGDPNYDPNYSSFHFTTYDNDYLEKDEIDAMVADMPEYEYKQEIMADFRENAEQIFKTDRIKRLDKLVAREPRKIATMGIDLGKGMDYTVVTGLQEGECFFWERWRSDWSDTIPRLKSIIEEYQPTYVRIDATGKGDPIAEQLQDEIGIVEPFVFSTSSKKQLLDKAALAVEKGMIALPHEKVLFNELDAFGRFKSDHGNDIYKPMKKITDDCVDSFALACWDMDMFEYETGDESIGYDAVPYPTIEY